uniref:DUF3615 domain-containing protein n=2 Tax=Oryza TaxID=4527 RepID=A0A0D3G2N1_9ORYZ
MTFIATDLFRAQSSAGTHQSSQQNYSIMYQMAKKAELEEQGRSVARYIRKLYIQQCKKLNIEFEEDEEPEGVLHPSDAGPFQHTDKEYATPNPNDVGHLSEIPSQQEQAEMPRLPCLNKPVEYCMSDEYIDLLDKKAKAFFSRVSPVKQRSRKETIANGLQYLTEEAFLAFRNYIAEKDAFEEVDYKFGEILHHCFSVMEYRKVYCHYNFTVEMKNKDEECWTSRLYFAETKLMHGVKYYFCTPLEATDDGCCNACKNQGVNELKHPSEGGYEKGQSSTRCQYFDGDSDEEC